MLPVLRHAAQSEMRVPELAILIADELSLSEAERNEMLPSGKQRLLHNRIHWAKFYMSKAGLIDSPSRGRFVASEAGRTLLQSNPQSVNVDTLKTYPAFQQFYTTEAVGNVAPDQRPEVPNASSLTTPEEQIDAADAILRSALKSV